MFHELEIAAVRVETAFAVVLTFRIPEHLRSEFNFVPGQYLTLRATIDGQDVRRSYSICSEVSREGELAVGIKRVEGGLFSNFAAGLQVGARLQVMSPDGRFIAPVGGTHRYLLIAAGSGITPCLSIIRSVLLGEPESQICLLYANQSTDRIMFRGTLDALKDRYLSQFSVHHFLSREHQDLHFLSGRLDRTKIESMARAAIIDPKAADAIYLCGPLNMVKELASTFSGLGVDEEKLHSELFTVDGVPPAPRKVEPRHADSDADADDSGADVTIIMDGFENRLRVDGSRHTVLQAAQSAGLDLPFSCAGGMCCTCRCKIVVGETQMDINYSLADWEIDAGFTLACQSRPLTPKLVLDFDAT